MPFSLHRILKIITVCSAIMLGIGCADKEPPKDTAQTDIYTIGKARSTLFTQLSKRYQLEVCDLQAFKFVKPTEASSLLERAYGNFELKGDHYDFMLKLLSSPAAKPIVAETENFHVLHIPYSDSAKPPEVLACNTGVNVDISELLAIPTTHPHPECKPCSGSEGNKGHCCTCTAWSGCKPCSSGNNCPSSNCCGNSTEYWRLPTETCGNQPYWTDPTPIWDYTESHL